MSAPYRRRHAPKPVNPDLARLQSYPLSVLPGSYLGRDARGVNPGANRVRIALVSPVAECVEAARRLRAFVESLRCAG